MERKGQAAGCQRLLGWGGRRGFLAVLSGVLSLGAVLALGGGCSAKAVKPASETPGGTASLEEAAKAVDAFEALESSGEAFFAAPLGMRSEEADRALDRLARAAGDIEACLKGNPEDLEALLLKARVLRAQDAASPMSFSIGPDGDLVVSGESRFSEIRRLVDEVLAKDPGNASAHYWKARVSAHREPTIKGGTLAYEGGDAEEVLRHAGKAMELAPETLAYREYYAQALLVAGRGEETMALMKDVAGGNHPIYRLLADWKLIPLPEDVVFDTMMTASMIQMHQASEARGSYPNLRMAVFLVPKPADEVTAFYRARLGDPGQGRDQEALDFPLILAWKGEQLVPVAVPPADEETFSGVLIAISETETLKPEEREALELPEGGKACRLIVNNTRKLGSP